MGADRSLLLIPIVVAITVSLLVHGMASRNGDGRTVRLRGRQMVLDGVFLFVAGVAFLADVVDTWVLVFASFYTLSRMIHVVLHVRDPAPALDRSVLQASVVALLAMVAIVAMDLLPNGLAP